MKDKFSVFKSVDTYKPDTDKLEGPLPALRWNFILQNFSLKYWYCFFYFGFSIWARNLNNNIGAIFMGQFIK